MNILRVVLAALLGSAFVGFVLLDLLTPGFDLFWILGDMASLVSLYFVSLPMLIGQVRVAAIVGTIVSLAALWGGAHWMTKQDEVDATRAFYRLVSGEQTNGALAHSYGATTAAERARACSTPPPFEPPPGFMHEQKKENGQPICGEFRLVPVASATP